MKEEFLHYVWQNQKIDFVNLKTSQGQNLQIIHQGNYIQQSGPDFFNSQIILDNQKWAGNIEIHVKASDWYLHHHERDVNYDNVILHVVWEYDIDIYRRDQTIIPVLELKNIVDLNLLRQYEYLQEKKNWINCESSIKKVPEFIFTNWLERMFFERLEEKSLVVEKLLFENKNHWEATLFVMMARNFGLNINGDAFYHLAKSIPFSVLQKESFDVCYLEALFLGQANLIPEKPNSNYSKVLRETFEYITVKYQLEKPLLNIQFYKLRPENFPTIRLAQLAALFNKHKNLFDVIINVNTVSEIYKIFKIHVSEFWEFHYTFDKKSVPKAKSLSKSFVDLLIINTILPIKFCYQKKNNIENADFYLDFLETIPFEKNTIIDNFKNYGISVKNAFQSQALLQLNKGYCAKNKCLNCAVGLELLKNKYLL